MPSGDLHTGVNLLALVGIAGPLAALHVAQDLLLPLAAGYLVGTLLITPERVMNVPRMARRNVLTTSVTFHLRSMPRFS